MATLAQKINTERKMRDLLEKGGLPQPDAVEYGFTCIRLYYEETKTVVVIDIDELSDDDDDVVEPDVPGPDEARVLAANIAAAARVVPPLLPTEAPLKAEFRLRQLLDEGNIAQPDAVRHAAGCITLIWRGPNVAIEVDITEDGEIRESRLADEPPDPSRPARNAAAD